MNRREVKKAPVLRFKGFTNDWEQRKFENLVSRLSKTSNNESLPNVTYDDIKSKENSLNKDITELTHGKKGIHFNKDDILFGKLRPYLGNILLARFNGIAVGDFWVLSPKDNNISSFLFDLIQTSKYKYISNLSSGSKMPRSDWNLVSKASFWVPIQQEQNKIGKIFQLIDNLVSLQQRKLELLKLFKIGMLQNILADTKAASKLKFKGSNQEWRPRRLNSITNIITKGTTPHFKQASNGVNFIKIEDISKDNGKIYPRSFITEKENNGYLKRSQLKAGDLLFSIAGTLGRVGKVTDDILPANTNQALAIIRLKPSQNIDFCKIMLESDSVKRYIHANPTMGAQPNLSLKQISDLTLFFPDIKEQTLISQLIKKIDNLLALQYQNISKFKQLKQFLLQNIFI